ncbi:uncharacterized protein LOC142222597 [Haematobia irritans]|uniref:uncharacterized protein LOC142222597 n=1 Tax=Haematobia irritans TaxID=7368 RepID=UPI003F50CFE7
MSLRRNTVLGPEILNFYEILDRSGFGKVQIWVLLSSGFHVMFVFTELMGMAIIAPASQCDLGMDDVKKSLLHGSGFLGIILSSFHWSLLADAKGRKWVLTWSTGIGSIMSIISSIMPNYEMFLLMRFLTGLCISGTSFSAISYVAEFCPLAQRPIVINYMAMFNGIAMLYCPTIAEILVSENRLINLDNFKYPIWRILMLIHTIPGILGILLICQLPESPEYLLNSSKTIELYKVLQWIQLKNIGEVIEIKCLPSIETVPGELSLSKRGDVIHMLHLEEVPKFDKSFRWPFILACSILFVLFLVGNGLGIWFTDLRNRQIFTTNKDHNVFRTICVEMDIVHNNQLICSKRVRSYRDSIFLGLGFIGIYNIVGLLLLRWWKRQHIIIALLIICGCCGIALIIVTHKLIIILTFICLLAIPNVLVNLTISTIMDFTSSRVRSKIICIAFSLGRIGVVLGSILVGALINLWCQLTFAIFTTCVFVAAFISFILPYTLPSQFPLTST